MEGGGWLGAKKWWVNPLCKVKTAKWHRSLGIKAAKFIPNLTSQSCGDLARKAAILIYILHSPHKPKFLNGYRAGWVYFKDLFTVSSDNTCSVKAVDPQDKKKKNKMEKCAYCCTIHQNHKLVLFILIIDGTSKQHKSMSQKIFIKV